ncbi:MAG: hypothetical protein K8I60_13380 [Anaerolineae bacterium]|nr:hypothetical protein [Anaerolineae bacterium]
MSHRPWYVVESAVTANHSAGLGRIGIGIFNRKPQPVWNTAHTIALMMAGEVYLPDQDQSLDETAVLELYEQFGSDLPKHIQGAFILGFWDEQQRRIVIMNDRFGLYPLYYAHTNHRFIFAPEVKGILHFPGWHPTLNKVALAEYCRFQTLLGEKTFFEGISLLRNASLLVYDPVADRLTITPYWDFAAIPELPSKLSFAEAAQEEGRLLKAAVKRLSGGDHRLGVYLSAGLDSRVLAGFLPPERLPLNTVTFGLENSRDTVYAARLAHLVGSNHHYFKFKDGRWVQEHVDFHLTLTEGFHSWIHAHGISILAEARSLMEVNLTGLRGGLIDWEDIPLFRSPDDLSFTLRLYYLMAQATTWPSLTDFEERELYAAPVAAEMAGLAYDSFREELAHFSHLPYERRANAFAVCNPDRRMYQYYTVFHRSHIEQRFPFFDYDYFDFIRAIPIEFLFERQLRRAVVLKYMPQLAGIPYDKDGLPITQSGLRRVGAKIINRTKRLSHQRFPNLFPQYTTLYADYENWLRGELYDWGKDLLLGEQTRQRGIFNPVFLQSLWERHQSGLEVNIIGKMAPLMTWEMLARRFAD